jgi:hypothetical protein
MLGVRRLAGLNDGLDDRGGGLMSDVREVNWLCEGCGGVVASLLCRYLGDGVWASMWLCRGCLDVEVERSLAIVRDGATALIVVEIV